MQLCAYRSFETFAVRQRDPDWPLMVAWASNGHRWLRLAPVLRKLTNEQPTPFPSAASRTFLTANSLTTLKLFTRASLEQGLNLIAAAAAPIKCEF